MTEARVLISNGHGEGSDRCRLGENWRKWRRRLRFAPCALVGAGQAYAQYGIGDYASGRTAEWRICQE